MLTLVDSSAWVEFMRAHGHRSAKAAVSDLLEARQAAVAPPVRFELLKGARMARELEYVELALGLAVPLPCPADCWDQAAELFRVLRGKGFEASNLDVLIATIALSQKVALLTLDRHFETINRYCGGRIKLLLLETT